ncbi:hypothetical protein DOTSEDRAFT_73851 [Dothistroma septosporum NZE10]|uniref:DUF7820 domain-containing protein n=1 Tax=Dothistroma septosporum (strain NZE10 / CBS 128990) TaxID=675120 RepID=N1PJQ6_DOTSN|nr:hypothetical protein DOTSEDRAFT_73851 [Dothistroma septosporum NZE10]
MEHQHSLLDGDVTPTHERSNIFGDEFEVDDFEFDRVVDGFRPSVDRDEAGDFGARQGDVTNEPVRTVSAHYSTTSVTPTISREATRTSTRKSRTYANPFASPEDDAETSRQAERPHSLEFEPDSIARRSNSSASSTVYAPAQSPRFGAGPSHPYGMYQQGTVARTASVTTASTVRPTGRQSYSQSRPQHPYAMYPQGVNDEDNLDDDEDMPIHQSAIPVGFPGVAQGYTRRMGPDGEDQDIIGADGHTEQLPPYSRYPEDGPEKVPLLPPVPLHSRAPVLGTDPSMPLMHTTIQPSPTPVVQSMTDESVLQRSGTRNSTSALLSSSSSDNASIEASEKAWKDKTWKDKRKTRFCGIPFWWILLSVCVVTLVAAVLGGVIGGFVAGGKHARNKPTVTVVTSLYDASLIASPTSGAPPTGTWALSLGMPEETQADCLPQASQQVAWDCNLAPNSAMGLVVANGGPAKGTGANIFYASFDNTIAYGAQLNNMNTSFANFMTVQDKDDPQNGPAFYFQTYYDKVVVVPEEAISIDGNSNKLKGRFDSDFVLPSDWTHRKQVALPGEKPWFCVWNSTFLEAFIYVQQPISSSTSSSSMASTAPPPNSTPPPLSSPALLTTASPTNGPSASVTPTPSPAIITSTIAAPSLTTATYTGLASGFPAWASGVMQDAARQMHADYKEDKGYHGKRQLPSNDFWSSLQVFPYIIKLEERRISTNNVSPYCQQYQILDNGNANWVGDGNGNPIIITLDEVDPNFATYEPNTNRKWKRTAPGGCHCQWMIGEQL